MATISEDSLVAQLFPKTPRQSAPGYSLELTAAIAAGTAFRLPSTHPLFTLFDPSVDPRPDLAEDTAAWGQLLTLAAEVDGDAVCGLTAGLQAIRCFGARLIAIPPDEGGGARIVPGEMGPEEYGGARDRLLVPHRRVLVELLGRIVIQEREGVPSTR